jgi:hypothetical protein
MADWHGEPRCLDRVRLTRRRVAAARVVLTAYDLLVAGRVCRRHRGHTRRGPTAADKLALTGQKGKNCQYKAVQNRYGKLIRV